MRSPLEITRPDIAHNVADAYRLLRRDVEANERKTRTSMPSTGTYVKGDFVWNSNPTVDGNNMIMLGWSRLTTGSGHVLGTDWQVCYVSTVTPAT